MSSDKEMEKISKILCRWNKHLLPSDRAINEIWDILVELVFQRKENLK